MEELFYRYNPWWEGNLILEGMIERPALMDRMKDQLSSKQVVYITGLRRIGKTTLMKIFIKYLIEKEGVNPRRIFYISMDDYLLAKMNIIEIIDAFRKLHKIPFAEKIFLFLDEIANKPDYEMQLKNLHDSHHAKIHVSSSSASVLKTGKAHLTGRNIILEVQPLDFHEFLVFRNIRISKADKSLLDTYFEEYLNTGGVPEYVLRGDMDYIRDLVDDIIQKDITAIYGIRNSNVLKEFFLLLMERAGKQASINKLAHILDISPDTARRYLHLFAESYLIHLIPRFGKTNERILSPQKVYSADLGIRTLFTGFRDKGSLFENYIFLKLKHLNPCYIYQDTIEIDFFTRDGILVEAKYKSEMSRKQQDVFGQLKAKKKYVIKNIHDADAFFQELSL
jgi:hypothetical protein